MKKILLIVGSLRKSSFNRQLAGEAAALLEGRATVKTLDFDSVPFMNQDREYPAPESVARVRTEVGSADAIWIFTPEYNYSYPGVLKNLLDWLSRPVGAGQGQALDGKPLAVSGISAGGSGTACAQDHLVTLVSFLNMRVMNKPRLTVPHGFDKVVDGRLELGDSLPYLRRQAEAFVEFVR